MQKYIVSLFVAIAFLAMAAAAAPGRVGDLSGVPHSAAQDDEVKAKLAKARELFANFDHDQAITLLSEVAASDASKEDKKECYVLLGRAYFAKDMMDKAKWALGNLAALSPPRIELDPDDVPPQFVKLYYTVWKEKTGSSEMERPDPGIQTLAILDFRNRLFGKGNNEYDGLQQGFADLMINQLNGTVSLKLVERERIAWILGEIGLGADPSKVDQASAVRAGKLLGVQMILFGSYVGTPGNMKLTARLVKVETGEIVGTEEVKGEMDDFFALAEQLSLRVAKKINVKVSEADFKGRTPTRSTDAWIAYSDGVALYDKGDYKGAFDKFQEAVRIDPAFDKAKKRIDSLKSLLG